MSADGDEEQAPCLLKQLRLAISAAKAVGPRLMDSNGEPAVIQHLIELPIRKARRPVGQILTLHDHVALR